MNVWLVGITDAEGVYIYHVCSSEVIALKRWEEMRLECLQEVQHQLSEIDKLPICNCVAKEMYIRILNNLLETDPKNMDNYPHEEPYITCMELEE